MLKIVRSLFKPHTKDMSLCQIFVCALAVVAVQNPAGNYLILCQQFSQ